MTDWVNCAAEIYKKKKDPTAKYIKVIKDFTALKGNLINLQNYSIYINDLFEEGLPKMKPETQENLLEKKDFLVNDKPTWCDFVLHVPPQEEKDSVEIKEAGKNWISNALEVRQTPEGKVYIRVLESFKVKKGMIMIIKSMDDIIKSQVSRGYLSEEEAKSRAEYYAKKQIGYRISIPPENVES